MSYTKVKRIWIENGNVYLNCCSNNVYPHIYENWKWDFASDILKTKGKEALEIMILKEFESGNLQGPVKKYNTALKILVNMPEYKNFNWRCGGIGDEYNNICKNRESKEFEALFIMALNSKLPKTKFVVINNSFGEKQYLLKITKRFLRFTTHKECAKIFNYMADAERIKNLSSNADKYIIEQVC